MTPPRLLTRRMLLKDMGKAGMAVMVLGTAACSTDPTENATPTPEPGSASTTSVGPTPSSAARESTSTGAPPTGGGHEWQRVDLDFVSAYILSRDGGAAIVDTGVNGSEPAIESALTVIGLGWGDVEHLIVTHKHPDHQGSLPAVANASAAAWYAGAGDIAAIAAPTEGQAVGDGDSVFDLEIIETPGHTPGHISVLDSVAGILVAGDALNGANPGVAGPSPDFSEDMRAANASVTKLAGFEYEVVLFGHGEPVLAGASTMVAELAANGG